MKTTHGGNLSALALDAGCRPQDILDFSANLNPFGPPLSVQQTIVRHVSDIVAYPEPTNFRLATSWANLYGCESSQVVPGRGATELIYGIPRCIPAKRALLLVPCYGDYIAACELAGLTCEFYYVDAESEFQWDWEKLSSQVREGDLVFVGRPNNPTGHCVDDQVLRNVCQSNSGATFVVDESFIEFVPDGKSLCGNLPPNCIVIRSMTKFYAIAGIRLGAAIACEGLAQKIRQIILPWSIDALAQRVGEVLAQEKEFQVTSRLQVAELRKKMFAELNRISGLRAFPSTANFILVRAQSGINVDILATKLLREHHIAVRLCNDYRGLDDSFFRLAVRTERENYLLLDSLRTIVVSDSGVATWMA